MPSAFCRIIAAVWLRNRENSQVLHKIAGALQEAAIWQFATLRNILTLSIASLQLTSMVQLQPKVTPNLWINATWEDFLQAVGHPDYAKAKAYYFEHQMRIEAMGVEPDHARENTIIIVAIALFCGLKQIPVVGLTNCSYRKTGIREAQPDISYYVGERAAAAPQGSSIVTLDDATPPPDLAIEIADSSLNDDLGKKRLLYEDFNVSEYWVVDVETTEIIAFQITEKGSRRISQSQVLAGLEIAVLREALIQCRQNNDSQVVSWLMTQFSSP